MGAGAEGRQHPRGIDRRAFEVCAALRIHEGNWSALVASSLNVVTSIALLTLLSTGVLIWARRKLRRRSTRGEDPRGTTLGAAA